MSLKSKVIGVFRILPIMPLESVCAWISEVRGWRLSGVLSAGLGLAGAGGALFAGVGGRGGAFDPEAVRAELVVGI